MSKRTDILLSVLRILTLVVFYNEFLVYHFASLKWGSIGSKTGMKIMLVADPQIVGVNSVHENFVTRWDSDRYLEATFRVAKDYFRPDVVVFLGDLMDEGSTASDDQFQQYYQRFEKLFLWDEGVKTVFVPGDNDISGEREELLLPPRLERFEKYFGKSEPVSSEFIEFLPLNRIASADVHHTCKNASNSFCVVLSHIPVNLYDPAYAGVVNHAVKPALTLSAHEHSSMAVQTQSRPIHIEPLDDSTIRTFSVRDGIELLVPTCSYRMGKPKMGYGALVIDDCGKISYTVLWSPSRFTGIMVYILILPFIVVLLLLRVVLRSLGVIVRWVLRRSKKNVVPRSL